MNINKHNEEKGRYLENIWRICVEHGLSAEKIE